MNVAQFAANNARAIVFAVMVNTLAGAYSSA
jgi:hypothetical protein